jgi:dolichol-phosphate mannosyltransferase
LKLKEMGSRYLFIALYCWLEKYFSRGDYKKTLIGPGVKADATASLDNSRSQRTAAQ